MARARGLRGDPLEAQPLPRTPTPRSSTEAYPMIPQAELERVKRDVDLVALMQARGVVLTRRGASWQGRCPFHEDGKTPSLSVTPSKGLWRCFGCGVGG